MLIDIQWILGNMDTVNTNFWIIRTKILINSGPYNGFSIDFTSLNTNSGQDEQILTVNWCSNRMNEVLL